VTRTTPTPRPPPAPRPAPRSRLRRTVLVVLAGLTMAVGGLFYMTRPARLSQKVVRFLEESIGCDAQVGRTRLTWGGILTVDGVDLTVPGETGDAAKLFHMDRVVVKLRLWPMVIGRVRAASVALASPTIYLTEDLDDGRFNYEKLLAGAADDRGRGGLPAVLPEMFLSQGEVRFGQVTSGRYEMVQRVSIDGTLTADRGHVGGYRFVLNQRGVSDGGAGTGDGASIHGRINLLDPMAEVQVDRFEFTGPHRFLLPQAMHAWWDRLSPRGALPRLVFSARLDENDEVLLEAEVEMDGIDLTLPVGGGQPLRLTGVSGGVTLTDGAVELEDVHGEVEGIVFRARGRIEGFEADAPLSVSVSTDPFDVPAEGGLWDRMPPRVRKYQERFSPQGTYQAQVTIERPTRGADPWFRGYLDLLDTRFAYNKFPYPAEKLTGRVTFDNQRVRLHDLVGVGPTGGRGVVSGTITPPGGEGAVDITIRGEGFPVDRYLTDAMKPKHRKVVEMFFDRSAYEDLVARGVLSRPGEPQGDPQNGPQGGSAVGPMFEPGGTASLIVRIQRPAGAGKKYRVTTDLGVAGLRSLFSFWHYPFFVDGGRVVITPEDVQVHHVRLRAVGGGGGVVDGRLELPRDGRTLTPYLQFTSIRLPIDRALVASIPEPKDRWVRSLNLNGVLIGTGEVFADDDGRVAFTVDASLQDGTATPNAGHYTLEDINGSVTVERTRVQLEGLTGRSHHGSISIDGQTDWGADGVGVDLTFTGDDLRVEPGLIDLLPEGNRARPMLVDLFDTYRPDGQLDARLHYQGGGGEADRFTLGIEPQSLSFDHAGQRIELTDMTGRAELTPDKARLYGVRGRYPAGAFKVNGDVRFGDDPGLDLVFDVDADRIDDTARAVLPAGVLTIIDNLSVQGRCRIKDARLLTRPNVQQGPRTIFEGKVDLLGARAQLGVPVTELDAVLDMHVVTFADQPWPHTDIRIRAERLRAADRLVERLSLNAVTGEQPWLIETRDIQGTIYGGVLIGRGQLRLGQAGVYAFDLTLQDVELKPFLHPLEYDGSAGSAEPNADGLPIRNMASGLLSASLSVRVPVDDPTQRQGRGSVSVRDATLYNRPISLAILQAINLTLPKESSFDRASARYIIYGNHVRFDDIRFEAPAFIITGTGTMDYSTTQLDLRMVTHNPTAPDLGPVSALVRTFKDELLGIEVKGTLSEPKARVVTLTGLFKSWDRVFGSTSAQLTDDLPTELPTGTQ
jgi:hypothetical protein